MESVREFRIVRPVDHRLQLGLDLRIGQALDVLTHCDPLVVEERVAVPSRAAA